MASTNLTSPSLNLTTPFPNITATEEVDDSWSNATLPLSPSNLLIRNDYQLYVLGHSKSAKNLIIDKVFGVLLLLLVFYFAIGVTKVIISTVLYWLWSFRRYYEEFKFQYYFGFNEDLYIHDSEEELLMTMRDQKYWRTKHLEKLETKQGRLLQRKFEDDQRFKLAEARIVREEKKLLAFLKKKFRDKEEAKKEEAKKKHN